MWPLLFLLLGPPLTLVWVTGLVALWRRPSWRPVRFLGAAFPALLVIVFVLGSQPYYPFGLVGAIFAIGAVPTRDWLARGGGGRRAVVVVLGGVNALVSAVIALPLVPVGSVGSTPIPGINQAAQDSIGWPVYVRQVAAAYRTLPAAEKTRTTVYASNYGEAGALDRYGPGDGLPRVYSAQNQLYFQGRPPAGRTTAVIVGGEVDLARTLFASCRTVGHLGNGIGVDNEEQGEPIAICLRPVGGWAVVWPELKHED